MKSSLSQAEVSKQLRNLLGVLRARQNDSGAIGAWRSSPDADPFVTPYVVQYLLEAKAAGYALPEGMLDEANGALRELAASGFDDLYLLRLRSWAVYLLTLQGEVTTKLAGGGAGYAAKTLWRGLENRPECAVSGLFLSPVEDGRRSRRVAATELAATEQGV